MPHAARGEEAPLSVLWPSTESLTARSTNRGGFSAFSPPQTSAAYETGLAGLERLRNASPVTPMLI